MLVCMYAIYASMHTQAHVQTPAKTQEDSDKRKTKRQTCQSKLYNHNDRREEINVAVVDGKLKHHNPCPVKGKQYISTNN